MYENYGGIWIKEWSSDIQSNSKSYGNTAGVECTGFALSHDDYITGYTIYFDSKYVYGLRFYTLNGQRYECFASVYDEINNVTNTTHHPTCGGWPYYLIGWNMKSGAWIDQIQFQFALLHENITLAPTTSDPSSAPTNSPSSAPTITTNTPTQTPTTSLSSYLTTYASINDVDIEGGNDSIDVMAIMFDTQGWMFYYVLSVFILVLIVCAVCIGILVIKKKCLTILFTPQRNLAHIVQANGVIEPGAV